MREYKRVLDNDLSVLVRARNQVPSSRLLWAELGELRRIDDSQAIVAWTNAVIIVTVPEANGTVRLGSERKFSSGTWKIFVILPRALAIDDDFKNLPWLKFRTFLASAN